MFTMRTALLIFQILATVELGQYTTRLKTETNQSAAERQHLLHVRNQIIEMFAALGEKLTAEARGGRLRCVRSAVVVGLDG